MQGMKEHYSSPEFTPGFLIDTKCHVLCHCPFVLTVWGRCHLYLPFYLSGNGLRRRSDFPKVTQQGLSSGIPPPSSLPLLLGSLAPAVSCSEVSGYFYSGARGSRAAEPCRLEGSRSLGFSRQGEAHCRDISLPGGSYFLQADLPWAPMSSVTFLLELRTEHKASLNPDPDSRSNLGPNLGVN